MSTMLNAKSDAVSDISMPPGPVEDPANWMGRDLQGRTDWQYHFTAEDLSDLDAALKHVKGENLDLIQIAKVDFPLPKFGPKLLEIRREVLEGRGFVLMRGFPVDDYSKHDLAKIYWGIGMHLGYPISQNGKGQLLGHITDLGEVPADAPAETTDSGNQRTYFLHPVVRGYNSRGRFFFHVDQCDIVGLCCLHGSRSGGESLIASSIAIHNEIMKRRPDLLRVLYEPFWISRQNEIPSGAKPYYQSPAFNWHDGRLTTFLLPAFVKNAESFPELPRLTPAQKEALALVDEIGNDPAFHLSMTLQKGDIQFLHNHTLLHTRTAYEDYPEIDRRRHLLRLWTIVPENRPLPQWIYDCTGGGRRGGICVPGVKEVASLDP